MAANRPWRLLLLPAALPLPPTMSSLVVIADPTQGFGRSTAWPLLTRLTGA
jgi:hypothetical protein